ncbi:glycosyltransferase [Sporosarcina sp. P2]|nr:glycosyltransferase [Sporosarcina sp. P2]
MNTWRGPVRKTAVVNLEENAVYRVKDGQLEKVDKPGNGFGKQVITWQDDKPLFYEVSYTKR